MSFVALLFGFTLAHLVASQARYNLDSSGSVGQPAPVFVGSPNQPGSDGPFPGSLGQPAPVFVGQPAPVFVGSPNQPGSDRPFPGVPVATPNQPGSDGSFAGVPPVATLGQSTPGLFPGLVSTGNAFPGVSSQAALSGVITLPLQQGSSFLNAQGTSFGTSGSFASQGSGVDGQQFLQGGGLQIGGQNAGFLVASSVITQPITPTVTQTSTVDAFQTLTDLVLHSVPVTQTQFTLLTTTQQTRVVVPTPVDDSMALSTTVLASPTFVTITDTSSDFRVVVRTSVSYVTLTHTSYSITHVPFTITATQTVRVTSPIVRTVINTSFRAVTDYRTVAHTVYVHGGYA